MSHDTLSPLGQEIAGALASFDEKIAGATGEDLKQRIDAAAYRVRHYVKTGRSIHDTPPPTLWQRIARWWSRLKH